MHLRQRLADAGAMHGVRPPRPHAFEEIDDRRRPPGKPAETSPLRFFAGCGQFTPRAARCSISDRKNGRSSAATRFS